MSSHFGWLAKFRFLSSECLNMLPFPFLQGKYTGAMRQKAELTDQIEQLEHIIMQLEVETEDGLIGRRQTGVDIGEDVTYKGIRLE